MQRHRKAWILCTLLSVGLVGCGPNNEAANNVSTQDNDLMRVGYYSNESHDRNGGNVAILDGNDNDGPATEMLDHTLGAERDTNRDQSRHGTNINSNFDQPLNGRSDQNYHGHLSDSQIPAGKKTYNRENHGNLSQEITQKVEEVNHVQEAETIISEQTVLIGVLLENNGNVEETKKQIQNVVQPQLNGKQLRVYTNESQYNRIKVLNNDLKTGGPTDKIKNELKNINNMGNE